MKPPGLASAVKEDLPSQHVPLSLPCLRRGETAPSRHRPGISELIRPTSVTLAILACLDASPASAVLIPEDTYTTPFQVLAGEEKTFVGGTVISPLPPFPPQLGGSGVRVLGGTAIFDPHLGDGTPIHINVSGNAIDGLYLNGGSIVVNPGGTYVYATGGSVRGIYNVISTAVPSQFDGAEVYVTTDYVGSDALRTYGAMATTVLRDSTLTTLRDTSIGAQVWRGAKADLRNTAISTRVSGHMACRFSKVAVRSRPRTDLSRRKAPRLTPFSFNQVENSPARAPPCTRRAWEPLASM